MEIVETLTKADYRDVRRYAFRLQAELAVRGIETEYSLEAVGPRKKRSDLYCMFIDIPLIHANESYRFLFPEDPDLFYISFRRERNLIASEMELYLGNGSEIESIEALVEDGEQWRLTSGGSFLNDSCVMNTCRSLAYQMFGSGFREIDVRVRPYKEGDYDRRPLLLHEFKPWEEDPDTPIPPETDFYYENSIFSFPKETTRHFDNLRHLKYIEKFYSAFKLLTGS